MFRRFGAYIVLVPFAVVLGFPFLWMLITTFKQDLDLYNADTTPYIYNPLQWRFWESMTTKHIEYIFTETKYVDWILNTLAVSAVVVGITLLVSLPAGYALARLSGSWGQTAGIGIFLVYLVPPTLLFLPLSPLVARLGIGNSLLALIVIYPSFTIPFATWLLMGFFKTIPQELEDAALVDGCSRLTALVRIVFPISLPGILTVVIFGVSLCVNEFIYAFTFITSSDNRTISTGVPNELIRGDVFFWQSLMFATLLPSLVLAFLYNTFLDKFIKGFTGGAFR
ncbi:MAG: carbohydrate ABC transporter permease [Thermoleophilia bacterium]|nr:carbohydrate ABC transporter permease [Thermoleophilia bacterium]